MSGGMVQSVPSSSTDSQPHPNHNDDTTKPQTTKPIGTDDTNKISTDGTITSPVSPVSPTKVLPPRRKRPSFMSAEWRNWHVRLPIKVQDMCRRIANVMDGAVVLIIIAISTLVTIFLDDIKVTSFSPNSDVAFAGITTFFLGLFGLELVINCLVKPSYLLSGFFIMDLISFFSLLPDIPWIWNPIIGLDPNDFGASSTRDAVTEVERIKRVSKNGEKLIRVLKFVKLIRLGRIAKLFEMAQRTLKDRQRRKRREERGQQEDEAMHLDDYTQSSEVGQTLSEQTIRNVVILVLIMLFAIPLLQPSPEEHAERFLVSELNALSGSPEVLSPIWAKRAPDGTLTVLLDSERDSLPPGYEAVYLSSNDLDPMLTNYQSIIGQPFDKYTFISGQINTTYLMEMVGPLNFTVCYTALNQSRAVMEQQFQWIIDYYDDRLLYLRVVGHYYANDYESQRLFDHRTNEMRATEDSRFGAGTSIGVFSKQSDARLAANYSLWRSFTTLMLLLIAAIAFDYNNKRMVIIPIERMVATIVQLRQNPLAKAIIDNDDDIPPSDGAPGAGNGSGNGGVSKKSSSDENNETGMLERTLQKLTGLLQVGFGDAGSRMIQKCMQQNSEGDLDPLVDGTRMLAIFGFCDIRRFTDATECLREDVMMYVNEIASIVHSHVSMCDGHPNKNVGDAFLVMWRLSPHGSDFDPDDLFQLNDIQPTYLRPRLDLCRKRSTFTSQVERDYALEQEQQQQRMALIQRTKQASASYPPITRTISALTRAQISILADKAVVSFLRIIVDLDASEELRTYENHPRIKAAFDDFIVQLGFGLHCGWSIEGPIGSRYKIDASYLSPHVNLSEALQDLTKLYGTPLLVSGEFYTLLSPYLKSYMRRLDVVKVVGRDIPMNLYAFDIHPKAMKSIIQRLTPAEYDIDADIDVLELKSSRYKPPPPPHASTSTSIPPNDGDASDGQPPKPLNGRPPIQSDAEPLSPLSPQSPSARDAHPLTSHRLFTNPSLNPNEMDFSNFTYSGSDRRRIHQLGPIATYHLVYNYRLSVLQCGIPYEFHDLYEAGLELYLNGSWSEAHDKMKECQRLYPEDVPTQVIIDVMKEHQFVAPDDWPGWHEA